MELEGRRGVVGLVAGCVACALVIAIVAGGRRAAVALRFEDGAARIDVPARLVDGSRYPAVLDPSLSAELVVDPPVAGPSVFGRLPAIAFDGTNFLVVWGDEPGLDRGAVSA